MSIPVLKVAIRYEHDVVLARQRARTIAGFLGFDKNEQTRISTAVSEIARNAYKYAGGGEVTFSVEGDDRPQALVVRVSDRGPGIEDVSSVLEGNRRKSRTGMGMGIAGAHRLMDSFSVESERGKGTTVTLGKTIPPNAPLFDRSAVESITSELMKHSPDNPFAEIQQQNQELLAAMNELKERQEQLERLNKELEDTNRGIVALYAELDEKASHLSRANELKARFLSNMSHEFRTPLNSIYSLSRILLDRIDGDLTPEQEKQVRFIKNAAEDLTALVNDLLDLAKIEAGRIEVHPAQFDVRNTFSALRGMLKPMIVNPSVKFVVEDPEGIPPMTTDEGKVSQILRNFISNAIKFTERGEIRVSARMSEDGAAVVFSVSDTGIGIPREHLQRIFEEYTQLDTPLHKGVKGTGLGLPLSKNLAEILGGAVSVESTPGIGSVFSAIIPVVYTQALERRAGTAAPDPTRRPVLAVDDDEATLALYEKYLRGTGFQVLGARTLGQAREILQEVTPEAIILDIMMQGEACWDFITWLKSNDATRDVPVFVVTVLEDRDKAFGLKADDFIAKPVERRLLLAKLRETARRGPIRKVLVIDDEEPARYIIKNLLADTKYEVITASGGIEGIKAAEEQKPDIIFLDLVMPDMDGFDTLEKLKASPQTSAIPVIIATSKTLTGSERTLLKDRTLAVISKGSSSREGIMEKVRAAILACQRNSGKQST